MTHRSDRVLNSLIEKSENWDKDERYMAINDMCAELGKNIEIDPLLERKLCAAILKRLDDKSNDVQSITVKCLGILLKKVKEAQIVEISEKLCALVIEGKSELRDVYSFGLKTLISDIPENVGASISRYLASKLLSGVQQEKDIEVKLECLDNLSDLMKRFSHSVESDHGKIVDVLLVQIVRENPALRKRATICIGNCALAISDLLLNKVILHLLSNIKQFKDPEIIRAIIQAIGTISRKVGFRLGCHLDTIVPLFLEFCGSIDDEELYTESSNVLRENCFQGFESFVLRCSREIVPHLQTILSVSLQFSCYDPNYSYGSDADQCDDDIDDEFDENDYGGAFDEDDSSWKVRRSAIKVLRAIITTRTELLPQFCGEGCDVLISRFKEREENVRIDVLNCFSTFLGSVLAFKSRIMKMAHSTGMMMTDDEMAVNNLSDALRSKINKIVLSAQKQLKIEKNGAKYPKTVVAMWQMLQTLCDTLDSGLSEDHFGVLIECALASLKDKHQGLKLESLIFMRKVIKTHSAKLLGSYADLIIPAVTLSIKEDGYKVIAEALRVISALLEALCSSDEQECLSKCRTHAPVIYSAILPRLSAHDIDQEIKECAISSMGILVTYLGSELRNQLPDVLRIFMERLKNEITRLATIRAIAQISSAASKVDLSSILREVVEELSLLLRQKSRPLKQASLEAILALLNGYRFDMDRSLYELILNESTPLIADSDLQLASLALQICEILVSDAAVLPPSVHTELLPVLFSFAGSPLLQGAALEALLSTFDALSRASCNEYSAKLLVGSLFEESAGSLHSAGASMVKQVAVNIALCAAHVISSVERNEQKCIVQDLQSYLAGDDPLKVQLSLLTFAELTMLVEVDSLLDLKGTIASIITGSKKSEEVRMAAAYALGRFAVQNSAMYLPLILDSLEKSTQQYLLLTSLKEAIFCHLKNGSNFDALDRILPHLFGRCTDSEEGVRNMVAECLGLLAALHSEKIVPTLLSMLRSAAESESGEPLVKWTVVTAAKHCLSGQYSCESIIQNIDRFTELLDDPHLDVRRAALLLVNAAVHHQSYHVKDMLSDRLYNILYSTMSLRNERVVDLGPFKHCVDDAEPLRKAALTCIDTIIDVMPEALDELTLLQHLAKCLKDPKSDVQLLSHQILTKLALLRPGSIIQVMDILIQPLESAASSQPQEGKVGAEVESTRDLMRSAIRCIASFSKMPDIQMSSSFQKSKERLMRNERLRSQFQAALFTRVPVDAQLTSLDYQMNSKQS